MSRGGWAQVGADGGEDLPDDVALETADDLGFRPALLGPTLEAETSGRIPAKPACCPTR